MNEEGASPSALAARNTRKTIARFLGSMRKQRLRLVIVFLSVAAYSTLNILVPFYSAGVVDLLWKRIKELRAAGESFSITWEAGGQQIFFLALLLLFAGGFYILQNFLMASFAERLSLELRGEVAAKLHRLPLAFFDRHPVGEIMSRVTNDLERMSDALQTGMLRLFVAVGTILGSIAVMLYFSVTLTLVFLVFVGISLLLTRTAARRTLRLASARQQAVGELNALVEEAYSGRMIIKSFNYEEKSAARVHQAAERLARAAEKTDFFMSAINPGIRLVNRGGMAAIAVLGGRMLLYGTMTPGVFQAFFQYVNQVGEPITELSYMINALQAALAAVERVYNLLDEPEMTPEAEHPATLPKVRGRVSFSGVRFGYTPDRILMKDVSFTARAGQKIAIVGSTGAGKTTMVNLLMRFYDVEGGQICLDGVDTAALARTDLRRAFGMVLQDTWLFSGSVAANIAYGKPDASRAEIVAAARAARADFFIRTLPQGYDTVLANDAENISVGQRQLLTIARVFLCDPAILILDEATSSVDTRTEMEIGTAMKALMKDRTSFVIAHRLSTIVDADLILVMQDGTIVEQGDHRTLLRAGGAYAELYNSQFA